MKGIGRERKTAERTKGNMQREREGRNRERQGSMQREREVCSMALKRTGRVAPVAAVQASGQQRVVQ